MKTLEPELLVSDANGIYIPQTFAQLFDIPENFKNYDEVKDILNILKLENSVEREDYIDLFIELENNAVLIANESEYYLYSKDGGLWCIPVNYDNEDFFN
jgi:hypothetical protein